MPILRCDNIEDEWELAKWIEGKITDGVPDKENNIALQIGLQYIGQKLVQYLIEKGLVNDQGQYNKILNYAAGYGDLETVQWLTRWHQNDLPVEQNNTLELFRNSYQAGNFYVESTGESSDAPSAL